MSGWVKLHRSMIDWEWYTDHNTCRLFIHCLLRANHCDTKWRGRSISRGQFITSLETLASETGLSVRQIRTSLAKLESTSELTSSGQARGRMITVSNYDLYQSDDKLNVSKMSGKCQADDRLMTTDKNVRMKEDTPLPPEGDQDAKSKIPDCPHKEIIQAYHEIMPELQGVIVDRWAGSARARDLSARWKESAKHQSVDFWRRYFTAMRTLPFYMGENDRNWKADLGWLIKRKNFDSTLEKLRAAR